MENTSYVGLHCPAREQLVAVSAVVPIEGENITTYTHPFARTVCFLRSFFSVSFSVLVSYTRYLSSTTLMLKLSGVGKKLLLAIVNIDDVHGSTTVTNLCNTM
jgi:hypothetical protein